jgi:hypothetical protein
LLQIKFLKSWEREEVGVVSFQKVGRKGVRGGSFLKIFEGLIACLLLLPVL